MLFSIAKKFEFSAAHRLDHLPDTHPCFREHGHNYLVIVELSGNLDERDFVLDYGELQPLRDMIQEKIDHRNLNEVLPCKTTAENIAKWFYDWCKERWPQVVAVRVSETEKTWAEYRESQ